MPLGRPPNLEPGPNGGHLEPPLACHALEEGVDLLAEGEFGSKGGLPLRSRLLRDRWESSCEGGGRASADGERVGEPREGGACRLRAGDGGSSRKRAEGSGGGGGDAYLMV